MINIKLRAPDETIGKDYLRRWHLRRKRGGCNLYLHRYDGSDDDRALHDHPWKSISILLWGSLFEKTHKGVTRVWPLLPKFRSAQYTHSLELRSRYALTLFFTFPKEREWGFHCPSGWVHWTKFVDLTGQQIGAGCPDDHEID